MIRPNKYNVERKEFFSVLREALDRRADVKKMDDPFSLRVGFAIDGVSNYLMRIVELKYAQDEGEDVSLYMNLEE